MFIYPIRALLIGTVVTLVICIQACIAGAQAPSDRTLNVVASFYPLYIMALNVTRDIPGVKVSVLAPSATGCLHDYVLTPVDMKRLSGASIFVVNGAGMESFLDRALEHYPDVKLIRLSDGLSLLQTTGKEGKNPHTWMDFDLHIQQVRSLAQALSSMDPSHAVLFNKNAAAYIAKLEALRNDFQRYLGDHKGTDIVTFHEAFSYFASEFGLNVAAVIEQEPGRDPSARELASIIDLVKEKHIPVLFVEPQYPSHAAQAIARETGARVHTLDPAVTGPDAPDAFLDIMRRNLKVLQDAFSPRSR